MLSKTTLTFIMVVLGFLLLGLEYAIILPTMWQYIHNYYGASEFVLGIIMSVFNLADMIASPMFGIWTDKTRKAKKVTIYCSIFQVIGNMFYFFGINIIVLILSRFATGFGSGFGSPIIAEMSKTIPRNRLTGVLAIIMIARQMGLIFGPAINLLLHRVHFTIGSFEVNNCNLPGLFMAVLWLVYIPLITFFMTDFHKLADIEIPLTEQEADELEAQAHAVSTYGNVDYPIIQSQIGHEKVDIRKSFVSLKQSNINNKSFVNVKTNDDDKNTSSHSVQDPTNGDEDKRSSGIVQYPKKKSFKIIPKKSLSVYSDNEESIVERDKFMFKNDLCKVNILTILLISFAGMFTQTALEGMLTPLTAIVMNWTDREVSLLFMVCGIELILVFILLKFISSLISDCTMLHISNIIVLASLTVFIIFIASCTPGAKINIVYVTVGVLLQVFSIPFLVVCSVSLYAKITNPSKQGIIQGIRRSIMAFSTILGPLWSTFLIQHLYTNFGGNIAIFLLCEVMLMYSTKSLMHADGYDQITLTRQPAVQIGSVFVNNYRMNKLNYNDDKNKINS